MRKMLRGLREAMRKVAGNRGMVAVFFAAVCLLGFVSSAVLMEFARIDILNANVLEALQLGSHSALSAYDETLFQEYGLLAAEQTTSELRGRRAFQETLEGASGRNGTFVRSAAVQLQAERPDGTGLHYPAELNEQIQTAMEWRLPKLVLDSLLAKWQSFQAMTPAVGILKAKLSYEEGLERIQQRISRVDDELDALSENVPAPKGAKEQTASAPSTNDTSMNWGGAADLSSILRQMSESLFRCYTFCISNGQGEDVSSNSGQGKGASSEGGQSEGAESVSAWGAPSGERRMRAEKSFQEAKEQYLDTEQALAGQIEKGERLLASLSAIQDAVDGVDESYREWGARLSEMPEGDVQASLSGDYLATKKPIRKSDLDTFLREGERVVERLRIQQKKWKGMVWHDISWRELSFDKWWSTLKEEGAFEKGRVRLSADDFLAHLFDAGEELSWCEGLPFSEEALAMQRAMRFTSQTKRQGLGEFVDAWNQRRARKADIKNASKHQQASMGNIADYGLNPKQQQRFEEALFRSAAGAGEDNGTGAVGIGAEASFNSRTLSRLEQTTELLTPPALSAMKPLDQGRLLTYCMGCFGCRLTAYRAEHDPKQRLSLLGASRLSHSFTEGELEYILFGDPQLARNWRTAEVQIGLIRMLANTIYAFSSATLRRQCALAAFALAGWTGFGVPILQSSLLLLLAAGESALDVRDLLAGRRVPILKNASNWRFSLSGIRPLAESIVSDLFDRAENEVTAGIEAAGELAVEGGEQMISSLSAFVADTIRNPIDQMVQELMQTMSPVSIEEIENHIDQTLSALQQSVGDGVGGRIRREAISRLQSNQSVLAQQIASLMEQRAGAHGVTASLTKQCQEQVEQWLSPILQESMGEVVSLGDEWEEKLHAIRQSGESAVQGAVGRWLDGFQRQMGSGETAAISTASALSMCYEDYVLLLLFLKIQTAGGLGMTLSRMGRVIHTQVQPLDLTEAVTELSWKAEVKPTLLMSQSVRTDSFFPGFLPGEWVIQKKWREGYCVAK